MSGLCLVLREGCGGGVCATSTWKDASIPGRSGIPRRLSEAELGPDTSVSNRPASSQPRGRDSAPGSSGQGRGGGAAELRPLPRPRPLPLAGRERGRAGGGAAAGAGAGSRRLQRSPRSFRCRRRRLRALVPPLPGPRRAERAGPGKGAGAAAGREPSRAEPSRDEEAGREGGAAGGHERGQDLPAAPLHGAALPGDGQHRRRRLLPEAVGAVQHLHLGHRR